MANIWFIARKDVQYLLRERSVVLWVFVMPVLFFYFIGTLTSTPMGATGQIEELALEVPADAGFLASAVEKRLVEGKFTVLRHTPGAGPEPVVLLRFPPAFTDSVLAQRAVSLTLVYTDPSPSEPLDMLRVKRAVAMVLADLAASLGAGRAPSAAAFDQVDAVPRTLTLRLERASRAAHIPSGFEHAIPGLVVMFVLFVLVTSGSTLLVFERERGMLRRLAATPITNGQIVLGKWGGKLILGSVQITVGMLIGTLLYRMNWGPNWPMVIVVLFGWGLFCASMGLFIGNIGRTEAYVTALGWLVTMSLAALGGCWWPIEVTPAWMQTLQKCLPSGWAMDAMHRLISFDRPPQAVLPHFLALVLAALLLIGVTARRFRYE